MTLVCDRLLVGFKVCIEVTLSIMVAVFRVAMEYS